MLTSSNKLLEIESLSISGNLLLKLQRLPRRQIGISSELQEHILRCCSNLLLTVCLTCCQQLVACNLLPVKSCLVYGGLKLVCCYPYYSCMCAFCHYHPHGHVLIFTIHLAFSMLMCCCRLGVKCSSYRVRYQPFTNCPRRFQLIVLNGKNTLM